MKKEIIAFLSVFICGLIIGINSFAEDKKVEYQNNNRIQVVGGIAPSGNPNTTSTNNTVVVNNPTIFVVGLRYDRKLNEVLNVGGTFLNNGTGLLGIGVDF